MRVLGIDPGFGRMGYGVVETAGHDLHTLAYGCIETAPTASVADRLCVLYAELTTLLEQHRPDAAAVEEIFYAKNARTVIGVAQARGVALLAAAQRGVPVAEYTPLQVKQGVVGHGRAQKFQVQHMVALLLNLAEPPTPDDTADALAVAICHCHQAAGR